MYQSVKFFQSFLIIVLSTLFLTSCESEQTTTYSKTTEDIRKEQVKREKLSNFVGAHTTGIVSRKENIEMKIMAKVQEKKDLFADRRHTFRLIDRRKKGVLDSSLWKINSKERRKEDERRSRK